MGNISIYDELSVYLPLVSLAFFCIGAAGLTYERKNNVHKKLSSTGRGLIIFFWILSLAGVILSFQLFTSNK